MSEMSHRFDEPTDPDIRAERGDRPALSDQPAPDDVAVWWLDLGRELDVDGGHRRRSAAATRSRRSLALAVVAHHLGVEPRSLRIDRTCQRCGHPTHGKPQIVGGHDVSFSVASRERRAVVAIAGAQMAIGVDLERLDPAGAAALYEVALTPAERGVVAANDVIAITRLWCRKEALLKAAGGGLVGRAPDTLDVRAAVVEGWSVRDLDAGPGWVAALAGAQPLGRTRTGVWA